MKLRAALASVLLAGTALSGPGAHSAPPALMQTVTAGTLGTWSYSVQFGEGTPDYGGGKGFCSDVLTDNLVDEYPAPAPDPSCSEYSGMRPGKRELKGLLFASHSSDDSMILVDTWVTRPHVERLRIKYAGGSKLILKKASSSTVLSLYGDRGRYWFRVHDDDSKRIKSMVGQAKKCKKVRGKRRCSWATVASSTR